MQLVGHEKSNEMPVPGVDQRAAAWLGQAGLYRTRFDAVRNFEQSVTPVTAAELFNLASKQVLIQINGDRQPARPSAAESNSQEKEGFE